MRIAILGGGNIGTALAVLLSERGAEVRLVTSRPSEFAPDPVMLDHERNVTHRGKNVRAFSVMQEALEGAGLIFFTYPAFLAEEKKEWLAAAVPEGSTLCFVPGNGGMEQVFKGLFRKKVTLCAMERVPVIARTENYGQSVVCGNLREELHVAALPYQETDRCCRLIEGALGIPTRRVEGYLNLTLTPSNPILHTSRLRTIFRDHHEGMAYQTLPLFYEDWDLPSAELLIKMDAEVQETVRALPELSLSGVRSLKLHYESETAEAMRKKLSSIPAFKGIKTPAKETKEGFVPDFSSRYFVSDFPYGLKLLLDTAKIAGVETPEMKETYEWYKRMVPAGKEFSFSAYGICDKNDLVSFYGNDAALH